MRMLDHADKTELWAVIAFFNLFICGFLALNQMVSPMVDALVPTILPCWVLRLFQSLTFLSAINSLRHWAATLTWSKGLRTIK
jgi:hypothetical protein